MYRSSHVLGGGQSDRGLVHRKILNGDVAGKFEGLSCTGEFGSPFSLRSFGLWLSLMCLFCWSKGSVGVRRGWMSVGMLSHVRGRAVGIMREMREEQLIFKDQQEAE